MPKWKCPQNETQFGRFQCHSTQSQTGLTRKRSTSTGTPHWLCTCWRWSMLCFELIAMPYVRCRCVGSYLIAFYKHFFFHKFRTAGHTYKLRTRRNANLECGAILWLSLRTNETKMKHNFCRKSTFVIPIVSHASTIILSLLLSLCLILSIFDLIYGIISNANGLSQWKIKLNKLLWRSSNFVRRRNDGNIHFSTETIDAGFIHLIISIFSLLASFFFLLVSPRIWYFHSRKQFYNTECMLNTQIGIK